MTSAPVSDVQAAPSAWTRAQAKLNLRLHVLAREVSGYHSIETVFHRVDFGDDVTVTLAPAGRRTIATTMDVGPPEQNLALRAATLFCEMRGWPTGFHIELRKRIPAGGGLGGGSADAAATLRVLNALAPDALRVRDPRELLPLARKLGADVPFLVTDAVMAFAWGHGDRMLLLPPLPVRHVALLFPPFAMQTADAYAAVSEAISRGRHALFNPPVAFPVGDLAGWSPQVAGPPATWWTTNDFALALTLETRAAATRAMEAVAAAGARFGGMTGSGSTLFAIFEDSPDAGALERATGCRVEVTRTADAVEPVHLSD